MATRIKPNAREKRGNAKSPKASLDNSKPKLTKAVKPLPAQPAADQALYRAKQAGRDRVMTAGEERQN